VAVNTMIPVARPWMDEQEAGAARRAILSGWVTQGPEVAAFEREFAEAIGTAHACAVSSCTTALHAALVALGVGAGDEVITVSHSFIATTNAIRYCGAMPVFVDIDPVTFNIDPALVEAAISPRTKAILAVHQLGMPCDLASLVSIATRHGVPLIEDAACAIGSEIEWHGAWQRIGRPHGDIACFSFHPRKIVTTGEGGAVTTDEAALDAAVRRIRHHGWATLGDMPAPGFNYRLPDLLCAIGIPQMARLEELLAARERVAGWYTERLEHHVLTPSAADGDRHGWQAYVVQLDRRDEALAALRDAGIEAQIGTWALHRLEPYRAQGAFPGADRAFERALALPLATTTTEEEVERVAAVLTGL